MKIQRYMVAALLFVSSTISACAQTETAQPPVKKIYVDAQDVKVTNGSIFITTEKGLARIKSLRSDRYGIYVFEHELNLSTKNQLLEKGVFQCGLGCYRIFPSASRRDYHEMYECPLR